MFAGDGTCFVNWFENWFCGSSYWRRMTRTQVIPWLWSGVELGEHVLELGAGPGAATEELRKHAARVTSLEYSHAFAARIARRVQTGNGDVLQGDASALPFPEKTFSAIATVLMLHHLKSPELQERAFAEIFRVLRPGGVFLAIEIPDAWFHRIGHIRSTFVPLAPPTATARLAAAGFPNVSIDFLRGAFRIRALRPRASDNS